MGSVLTFNGVRFHELFSISRVVPPFLDQLLLLCQVSKCPRGILKLATHKNQGNTFPSFWEAWQNFPRVFEDSGWITSAKNGKISCSLRQNLS